MRQIKFRAKTTANGHWVYGSLIEYGDNAFAIRNNKSNPWVQPDSIGQFTGLTDCNGKEIYEGDILSFPDDEVADPEVIIFEDGCFQVDDGWFKTALCRIDVLERIVIGNVFDNPEMIKR